MNSELAHPNEGTAVAVGDLGPDFALANTDGRIYQLSEAGGTTLLIFYRGDW
jgi:peroxiredoxin